MGSKEAGVGIEESWTKYRALKTIALYLSFLGLGFSSSINGPAIVSMEVLLNTDTKSYSAAFSGGALGYLAGAVISGFIYSRINKELLFALALCGVSVSLGLAPFSWSLAPFVVACVFQGIFMAFIDTAGQAYILKLWEGHRYKESFMQCAHFIWSVGSTLGPFITSPFLVDMKKDISQNSTQSERDLNVTTVHEHIQMTTEFPLSNSTDSENAPRVELVRFAYIIIASLVLVCSILFVVIFFMMKPSCRDRNSQKDKKNKDFNKTSERRFKISLMIFIAFFYFFYLCIEGIPGSFLAAFVVKGLNWQNRFGAIVTSTFWGAHGIGRLLGIPIATRLTPLQMLLMDMIMAACGFGLLLFVPFLQELVWVGIIIAGLSIGTIFASGILWLETYIKITGEVSSCVLTSTSLSGIVGPMITGFLFDKFGHMVFTYVIFTASVLEIVVFLAMFVFAKKHKTKINQERKSSSCGSSVQEDNEETESLNTNANLNEEKDIS